jgi:predicted ATPase
VRIAMLTRLKISGFKNLVEVDVRFGPFTCVAGVNGVGKSNLFDAIRFLSALADRPLMEAAMSVRAEDGPGRTADIRSLFCRQGDRYLREMSFDAEMVIPLEGEDDFGQKAKATTTLLRYSLVLGCRDDSGQGSNGSLEIIREELVHLLSGEAHKHLLFPHTAATWRRSAVQGRRSGSEFISTEGAGEGRVIKLHQDGGGGRPLARRAADLPRTILSATNAAESPTACLVRREMRSWQLLQLEPSALRRPDEFNAPTKLGPDGAHLPATLFWLASHDGSHGKQENGAAWRARIYAQVADRLSELIEDVHGIAVDRDEKRELLTVFVTGRDQTPHAARALSDGTLRFLALAVLVQDPHTQGVLCLEEPENGIHPARIPAMIRLLQGLATDPHEAVGPDNPLRQVIVNTHSPAVVQLVPDDSLLVAEQTETAVPTLDGSIKGVTFSYLPDTWRAAKSLEPLSLCPKGKLLHYLNPFAGKAWDDQESMPPGPRRMRRSRRVVDREDVQPLLFPDHRS